jgi:hypothetical protein
LAASMTPDGLLTISQPAKPHANSPLQQKPMLQQHAQHHSDYLLRPSSNPHTGQ